MTTINPPRRHLRRGASHSRLVRLVQRVVARAGRAIGLNGTEGGQRRFVLVAFGLRFLLVAVTPAFFLLPVRQYGFAASRWNWLAALIVENVALGYLALRKFDWLSQSNWGRRVRILDFIFAFAIFLATTRSSTGVGVALSDVVVVGAFQLQTYGPVIVAGALEGVWEGAIVGVFGAILYPLCLIALGRSWAGLFGATQIANTIGRSVMYLFVGVIFGLLSDFVARLIHYRAKFRELVSRRLDANRLTLEAQAEARLREHQLDAARRLERDAYGVLHRRGLSDLRLLIDDLTKLSQRSQRTLAKQFVQGKLIDEIAGIAENMARHLAALRRIGSGLPSDSAYVTDVVQMVVANQKLARFHRSKKPVVFRVSPSDKDLFGSVIVSHEEATDLDWMIREGIRNSYAHAADGTITVAVSVGEAGQVPIIEIIDAGPPPNSRRRRKRNRPYAPGVGHTDCIDRATRHGWTWSFTGADEPGAPGRFSVALAPDVVLDGDPKWSEETPDSTGKTIKGAQD